jgi:formiminotetrahydrofolate cyclodeaminase
MLMELTVNKFLSILASDAPAPGGGSVAALNGAIGAALISMVCRLSIGRKELDQYENELLSVLEKAEKIGTKLSTLVDRDTVAFNHVMAAFRMPKTTGNEKTTRKAAIQDAFRTATEVPLDVALHCCTLLELAVSLSRKSNSNTASDLGVSAQCSYSGLMGALMNVNINIPSVTDEVYTSKIITEVKDLRTKADSLKLEMANGII